MLGLEGVVTDAPFEALRENRDWQTGKRLTARANKTSRMALFDIQISAPKDVSVLAIVGENELVREAAWQPQIDHPPMRFVRFFGTALTHGVVSVRGRSAALRVYSPAKTVADCLKFRQKIGLDVAIEALREGWREKKFTIDEHVDVLIPGFALNVDTARGILAWVSFTFTPPSAPSPVHSERHPCVAKQ